VKEKLEGEKLLHAQLMLEDGIEVGESVTIKA
jgi:hypothetical protein